MSSTGRLGGERFIRLRDRGLARFWEMVKLGVSEQMVDGFAPGSEPLTDYEKYQKLLALRGSGSPAFWANPQAEAQLAQFEQRFGPVQPLAGPGLQPGGVPGRTGQVLATTEASQKLGEAI